jgi:hypothetical protein
VVHQFLELFQIFWLIKTEILGFGFVLLIYGFTELKCLITESDFKQSFNLVLFKTVNLFAKLQILDIWSIQVVVLLLLLDPELILRVHMRLFMDTKTMTQVKKKKEFFFNFYLQNFLKN